MAILSDRTELTTPDDGDLYVTTDVSDTTDAATGTDKKITWANIKAGLKTYFDTLYQPLATVLTNTTASFTTALESKLNGVEAAADVTDVTNVTAAGALMDSECASLADVKALNQSVVSGAAPVFTTTENAQTGTTYTLVLTDASKLVSMSNASANTLTVPPNSSVAFAVGTKVMVQQRGAGSTTIAAGAGVTINAPSTVPLAIGVQYESRVVVKTATDTWQLV